MDDIKYHYALDEQNRLVNIEHLSREDTAHHTYHCVGCGGEMIARKGKVRKWHFAHRDDDSHCGTETYLHKLAKRLIKEKFESDSPFMISYYKDVYCSDAVTCPFSNDNYCHVIKLMPFDLKEYYDLCQEEKKVYEYTADLLFTSTLKPDREPLLIEIQVSHKSTQQKLSSGLHIIEIPVRKEEDIISIISDTIKENSKDRFGYVLESEEIGNANFHNFKKSPNYEPLAMRSISRFFLYRSGKAFVVDEERSCRDVRKKKRNDTIFEASIDYPYWFKNPSTYDFGYVAAILNGIEVKNCQFCEYHCLERVSRDKYLSFCCGYKSYGTPMHPYNEYAKECSYYIENCDLLNEIYNKMPPIVVASSCTNNDNM